MRCELRLRYFFFSLEPPGRVTIRWRRDLVAILFQAQIWLLNLVLNGAEVLQLRGADRCAIAFRRVHGEAAMGAKDGDKWIVEEQKGQEHTNADVPRAHLMRFGRE